MAALLSLSSLFVLSALFTLVFLLLRSLVVSLPLSLL